METTFLNKVKASRFLSWYFSNSSDAETIGYDVISALKEVGEYTIDVNDLFDCCGYIPGHICVDAKNDIEYEPSQVELIKD
jgi:hypothetical protein